MKCRIHKQEDKEPGKTCPRCRQGAIDRRAKAVQARKCVNHPTVDASPGKTKCEDCCEYHVSYYRTRSSEAKLAEICFKCKKHRDREGLYCQACNDTEIGAKYKLSGDEYRRLMNRKKCDVCEIETQLHLDHCHTTGRVRGVLCGPCNRALGLIKDRTDILNRMVKYLES